MNRHKEKLSPRIEKNHQPNRPNTITMESRNNFFDMMETLYLKHELKSKPENVWNCDESGFSGDPDKQYTICNKGRRQPYKIESNSDNMCYTTIVACNANGEYTPPLILYKSKYLAEKWSGIESCGVVGPPGAIYGTSKSGWMEVDQFTKWFKKIFIPIANEKEGIKLLILDKHKSHIGLEFVELAIENNIEIVLLPTHISHRLQPLDVGVNKEAKSQWRKIVKEHLNEGFSVISKLDFPKLFKKLLETAFRPELAINGFSLTGIYPLNRDMISLENVKSSQTFEQATTTQEAMTGQQAMASQGAMAGQGAMTSQNSYFFQPATTSQATYCYF
jgi:hypothetical protein